jgi:hypothetical protein
MALKDIFDTLDTFGNERVSTRAFFQRVHNHPSSLSLLATEAVRFPQIGRAYSLEKVLFDLENKGRFAAKVDWGTLHEALQSFLHIQ